MQKMSIRLQLNNCGNCVNSLTLIETVEGIFHNLPNNKKEKHKSVAIDM